MRQQLFLFNSFYRISIYNYYFGIIVTNSINKELSDVLEKVFTRELFNEN